MSLKPGTRVALVDNTSRHPGFVVVSRDGDYVYVAYNPIADALPFQLERWLKQQVQYGRAEQTTYIAPIDVQSFLQWKVPISMVHETRKPRMPRPLFEDRTFSPL